MDLLLYIIISTVLVGLAAFAGLLGLAIDPEKLNKIILYLVSFSVGALLGDAFIHIIPEAFQEMGFTLKVPILILCGYLLFFVMEKFLLWRHCHDNDCQGHVKPLATLSIVGDAVHNVVDGMFIASSYLISLPLGISTTLAVFLHEIPHELGNFAILVHSGIERRNAILYNLGTGVASVIGAIATYYIGVNFSGLAIMLLPVTAGGFLYVAGSDLIPELHHENKLRRSIVQLLCIFVGILIMSIIGK